MIPNKRVRFNAPSNNLNIVGPVTDITNYSETQKKSYRKKKVPIRINVKYIYFGLLSFYSIKNTLKLHVYPERLELLFQNTFEVVVDSEITLVDGDVNSETFLESIPFDCILSISYGVIGTKQNKSNKLVYSNSSPSFISIHINTTAGVIDHKIFKIVSVGDGLVLNPNLAINDIENCPSKFILAVVSYGEAWRFAAAVRKNKTLSDKITSPWIQSHRSMVTLPVFLDTTPYFAAHFHRLRFPQSVIRKRVGNEKLLSHIGTVDDNLTPLRTDVANTNIDDSIYLVFPVALDAIDAITVHRCDLRRLQPPEYLNDILIDLFIKVFVSKLPLCKRRAMHAFSCQFYTKLLQIPDDGKAAHASVARWTSNIDLFRLDFILIPINFAFHWSLCVVFNPKALLNVYDEKYTDIFFQSNNTCNILMLDSLGMHNSDVISKHVKQFLFHEWDTRYRKNICTTHDDDSASRVDDSFVSLMNTIVVPVPRQSNGYDCGVFIIKFVECILLEWPLSVSANEKKPFASIFIPSKFTQSRITEERLKMRAIIENIRSAFIVERYTTKFFGDENCEFMLNDDSISVLKNDEDSSICYMKLMYDVLCALEDDQCIDL
jgi:hypothetical protein